MKTIYHVPTEQFGFIELETENPAELTYEQVTLRIEQYKAISEAVKGTPEVSKGISEREFNAIYDQLLNTGKVTGDPGVIGLMCSPAQKTSLNDLKKGLKRLKARGGEPVDYVDGMEYQD